ncbi:MAG: hypothetical protein ACJAQ3_001039 [Planctomycetota bacterium]|jgi:hypothetical protein
MVHALLTLFGLLCAPQGAPVAAPIAAPTAEAQVPPAISSCSIRVEIISAGTTASFEGARAFLEPVPGKVEHSPLDAWTQPRHLMPIPDSGVIEFSRLEEGLFQLRMVDGLGMPILDEPGPVFVSAVQGAIPVYRVLAKHLDQVEGLVVDASGDRPIVGAIVRIDPRSALRSAPRLEVITDEEGRYRVSTARSEVVAVDAMDYRTINARFGPSGAPAPLRMRPMQKRRFVVIEAPSLPPEAAIEGVRLAEGYLEFDAVAEGPRLVYASRLMDEDPRGAFVPMTPGEDGMGIFPNVRYDFGILYRSPGSDSFKSVAGKVSQIQEFLIKRGGGAQKIDRPEPAWRNVELKLGDALGKDYSWLCSVALSPKSACLAQGRLGDTTGAFTFRVPVDSGAEGWSGRFRWGLLARGEGDRAEDRFHFEWRGAAVDPVENGSMGTLAATSIQEAGGPLSAVLDGDWLGHGTIKPDAAGDVLIPRVGGGTLYISSPSQRGDVTSTVVGPGASAAAEIKPVRAVDTVWLDFCVVDGEDPIRGLALRFVPVGLAASDEILDLLGETPLVTDASGTVHLRGFVPGAYEVRVDASRSVSEPAASRFTSSVLPLVAGTDAKIVWHLPPAPSKGR